MTNTTDLPARLRKACADLRHKPIPLADMALLMQQAADALEANAEAFDGTAKSLRLHMEAFADAAYCRGCEVSRKSECLGEEIKMKIGAFGQAELDAHRDAQRQFGAHFGIYKALKTWQQTS